MTHRAGPMPTASTRSVAITVPANQDIPQEVRHFVANCISLKSAHPVRTVTARPDWSVPRHRDRTVPPRVVRQPPAATSTEFVACTVRDKSAHRGTMWIASPVYRAPGKRFIVPFTFAVPRPSRGIRELHLAIFAVKHKTKTELCMCTLPTIHH